MQAKAVSWAGQSSPCQVSRPTGPVMPPSEPVPGPSFASQPTGRSFAAELQFAADGTVVEVLGAVVLELVVGAVGTVGAVGVVGVIGVFGMETLVDGNVGVLVRPGMDVGRVTEGIDAEDAFGTDGTEVAVELPVEGTIAGIDAVVGGPVAGMPLPLRALPGVGPRSEERLARAGLASIGDLAGLDDGELARLVPGSLGPLLRDRARGLDDRPVARERAVRISIGQEETFDQDVDDPVRLHEELERMIHRVVDHLERDGRGARTVTAKLRYPDWTLSTRARSTPKAVRERAVLVESAHAALERALADRPPPVRLLGVAVSNLEAERQPRLPGV